MKGCRTFHVQKPQTVVCKNAHLTHPNDLVTNDHSLLTGEKKLKSFLACENIKVLQKLPAFVYNPPPKGAACHSVSHLLCIHSVLISTDTSR